jgi:hypothetical protein
MKTLLKFSPLIVTLLIAASGCIGINRNFREVRATLISKFGNDYHREIEVSVGPFLINFASWVVNLSQEDEIVDDLMRQVSNVQVGVYTMTKDREKEKNTVMEKINSEMQSRGWRYIVRSYSDDELTAVYVSKDPEMFFKKMFIITHDSEQLVLVEVEGKLDKLIELAIHDKKFKFDM